MGYRSDVRIAMSKNGFEQFKKNVQEHINEYKNKLPDEAIAKNFSYDLLNNLDINSELDDKSSNQVYFGWNDVKWYDGYEDVDAIMDSLNKLEEQGFGYNYARIGEQYDDIEELFVSSTDKDNVDYIESIGIERYFNDDNYINNYNKINEQKSNKVIKNDKECER